MEMLTQLWLPILLATLAVQIAVVYGLITGVVFASRWPGA